jgi:hypothetical protein
MASNHMGIVAGHIHNAEYGNRIASSYIGIASPLSLVSSKNPDKKIDRYACARRSIGLCYCDAGSFAGREERLNGSRYWR